jgi:hypothetical protein
MGYIGDNAWKAGEHGIRAAYHLRSLRRAVEIARTQGGPCFDERMLDHIAQQAWANAKLAAHFAMLHAAGGR